MLQYTFLFNFIFDFLILVPILSEIIEHKANTIGKSPIELFEILINSFASGFGDYIYDAFSPL